VEEDPEEVGSREEEDDSGSLPSALECKEKSDFK
jgi:hypothetical protein